MRLSPLITLIQTQFDKHSEEDIIAVMEGIEEEAMEEIFVGPDVGDFIDVEEKGFISADMDSTDLVEFNLITTMKIHFFHEF